MCQNGRHTTCARCRDDEAQARVRFKDANGNVGNQRYCGKCAVSISGFVVVEAKLCACCGDELSAECVAKHQSFCATCQAARPLRQVDRFEFGAIVNADYRYHGEGGCDDQVPEQNGHYDLEQALQLVH